VSAPQTESAGGRPCSRELLPTVAHSAWFGAAPLAAYESRFACVEPAVRSERRLVLAPPRIVSIPLAPAPPGATAFRFAPCEAAPQAEPPAGAAQEPPARGRLPARHTRIRPPDNVIGLRDRLFYLLQPSLETILGGGPLACAGEPFAYQFEGIAFLYPRYAAVLADEMGLGKTMQAVTAARLLIHAGQASRVLIVCPKPLVTTWQREFAQWAPELPVCVVSGPKARRRWQWQLPETVVTIANYELVTRDADVVGRADVRFDLVVLDESQRIKNHTSATSHAVRSIARTRSWALTGTPVENSPRDLVGIFEFVAPGHLSPEMRPRSMGRAASGFVLRRTKPEVLSELPPKLFRDAEVELSPAQQESYRRAEEEGVVHLTELGQAATIQHVFELVLRLKQICNFDPLTGESAKYERLAADLEEVAASSAKAIVFSQWVRSIELLARRLRRFGVLEYHGDIPSSRRDAVIAQFREDRRKHVLLMSYGAGAVGLNLQFASYVFLFDRWWNPAVEDQAINRAHRIGAAGPVTVTRFLSLGTIEERIDQVLAQKRELFDTIFSDLEPRPGLGLTQDEIFGLFRLRKPAGRLAA
jgi:SNF2 family DNA or RNA helicase